MVTRCCTSTSSGAGRVPVFNAAFCPAPWRAGGFHQFQAVRGHQRDAAGAPRRVADRPARCTSRATPLPGSDLQSTVPPAKSTPRSRLDVHTTAQPSSPPQPIRRSRRAVRAWCPPGPAPAAPGTRSRPASGVLVNQRCHFRHSALHPCQYLHGGPRRQAGGGVPSSASGRVLQHQRRRIGLDGLHHLRRQQDRPMCPAQANAPRVPGQQHLHLQFVDAALHQQGLARGARGAGGTSVASASGRVAQRGRHAPTAGAGSSRQARQRQLPARRACCPPARAIRPPPPAARWRLALARVGAGQQQRHAFRRGDQHRGQAPVLRARSPLAVSPVRRPLLQCGPGRAGFLQARSESAASARMGVIHSTVSGGDFVCFF